MGFLLALLSDLTKVLLFCLVDKSCSFVWLGKQFNLDTWPCSWSLCVITIKAEVQSYTYYGSTVDKVGGNRESYSDQNMPHVYQGHDYFPGTRLLSRDTTTVQWERIAPMCLPECHKRQLKKGGSAQGQQPSHIREGLVLVLRTVAQPCQIRKSGSAQGQ